MKTKYRVIIEEVISKEFEVLATSREEAISKAVKFYESGEFVLNPGNVEHRQISVVDDCGQSDWIEF